MTDPKELIERLRTDAEWAEGQERETTLCLLDDLRDAITVIAELEQVKREREAAVKETERMKFIMREHGITVIPSKYPGGKSEWNTPPRGPQEEG